MASESVGGDFCYSERNTSDVFDAEIYPADSYGNSEDLYQRAKTDVLRWPSELLN